MDTSDCLNWQTSSYTNDGHACVEVAPTADGVLIRDTKDHNTGPTLRLDLDAWDAFLTAALTGTACQTDALTLAEVGTSTPHAGVDVPTRWHLTSTHTGATLHFTTQEWDAYLAGARDGEFTFPRQPALASD